MIEATIVADSITRTKHRITTYVITYPRFILAEFNTHRVLSRNSASSRAIPVEKMIQRAIEHPAEPVSWGKNQRGMQASQEVSGENQDDARRIWLCARDRAVEFARDLVRIGIHKQIANRLLEPFSHITTLVTATEWGNFFNLRAHPDAQPEFQELAYKMLEAYGASVPQKKDWGEWHLPFADKYLAEGLSQDSLLKIVTARAARVSYLNFEGDIDHQKDFELHDQLLASGHMSPFEHAARAAKKAVWTERIFASNFRGWIPYRKFVPNENRESLDVKSVLATRTNKKCTKSTG